MSFKFEQFVRFTTDSVGLERTFRLFQSIVQILSNFALPFDLLLQLFTFTTEKTPSPATTRVVLKALNQRLALARRFFRLFRFLDSFSAAQKLSSKLTAAQDQKGAPPRGFVSRVHPWIDVFAKTFMGMYLLLEASTIVDALQVPGLAIWTAERERTISVEAQRFWLFSLVCSAVYSVLEISFTLSAAAAAQPAPASKGAASEKKKVAGSQEKRKREVTTKVYKLGRGATASLLDIFLPGTAVGWVKAEPGTVGLAMFVTTILTMMDVWERCGREVAGAR
ncbi:peroxisomal biogenesis factor 11 [Daldinia caldariorum]|uniref:peroxisomal biogenesis factor 11 n=1 Tax=Daldinia caldariorum TaxID=326644 RepID=UPI0020077A8D|nr:peroxisomal biogenesis factor 11 [Daldinia caldariorum]KAI1472911.1 peroxisomal biogenesis factor 11 [Daldinia caldariorum]